MSVLLRRAGRRHLVRHPWLIGLSVLGVAVAVAVVVGIDLANTSARKAFLLSVEGVAGRATHEIVGGPGGLPEEIYATLRTRHGLDDLTPIVESRVALPEGSQRTLRLLGIDVFVDDQLRSFTPRFRGDGSRGDGDPTAFLTQPGAVYLGEALAQQLAVQSGDSLKVRAAGEVATLEVVGLLTPPDSLSRQVLQDLLIVDISSAQEILGTEGALSRIDLVLPLEDVAEHEAKLAQLLPPGAELQPKSARSGALDQMTRAFRLNLTALSLLALLVGMFLIYNTMTFSVVQRRTLIGTLRALGVTRRQIFSSILTESALVGVVGSIAGIAAGIFLARGLLVLVAQTINDLYFAVSVTSVEVPVSGWIKGALLGVGGTLLASLKPASEATTAPPRKVLTRSDLEQEARLGVRRVSMVGFALMAASALLLLVPSKSLLLSFTSLFLFVLGFAALVPGVTLLAMNLLGAPMRRLFGVLGAMAARGVSTTLSRTGVAIGALVIAVSVTIGVGVMVTSFRSTLIDWLEVTLAADVYVAPADPGSVGGAKTLDPDVLPAIAADPRVASLSTIRRVRVGSQLGPVLVAALGTERPGFAAYRFVRGRPDDIWQRFRDGAAIISESFAYHHDLAVGSSLELATDRGPQSFEVAAVYYDYGSDRGVVTLNRTTYDRFWEDPALFSIGIFTRDGVDHERLIADLSSRLGERETLRWVSNRDLRQASLEIFDRTFQITDVLRLLSVMVAFIGVLTALMALQLERSREFGVLRANGLTPRQVWGLVTAQCGLMGGVAGLLSLPLGTALAALLIHIINRRSFGWTLQMEVAPMILLQAVALALAAAFLAGLYPAYRLARTSPALALREE
ncbi:MAG: FtsX-like permease family protein [Acidobacteriota bacterium]